MPPIKPVASQDVRRALRAELRASRTPCPVVDRSAIESRERLRRIFELLGEKPPVEELPEPSVEPMMTVREVSATTGLTPRQVYGDLRRWALPYSVRRGKGSFGESVMPASTVASLLHLRTVRDYDMMGRYTNGLVR